MEQRRNYIRRNAGWILALIAITGYIFISGKTGSCPTCSAITQMAGIMPTSSKIDPESYRRLGVGDIIPQGTVRATSGQQVDVLEKISKQPAVLIFYRGGWCPYCNRHLSALVDITPELKQLGIQLLAFSPDRYEILNKKPALSDLPYTLLSDSKMEWTSKFGIAFKVEDDLVSKYRNSYNIDLEADSGETHHLLPHPSVFVVDQNGVIRFAHTNEKYNVRMDPEKILEAARVALAQ